MPTITDMDTLMVPPKKVNKKMSKKFQKKNPMETKEKHQKMKEKKEISKLIPSYWEIYCIISPMV